MFAKQGSRRIAGSAIASGLVLALGAAVAFAQPGPGMHGRHGGGEPLAQVIQRYHDQLQLDSSQQQMWDNAIALGKQARQTGRTYMQQVHDTMAAELAKPEPDLAAVAAVGDDARAKGQALHKQVRDAWLSLYATFTPAQKGVVRDALLQRMQRFDQMRERMRERFGGGKG